MDLNLPAQRGSIDAQAYTEYLRSTPGRLRNDIVWENLCGFLPEQAGAAALDVGGGTGQMAVQLAERGFQVTALDVSGAMLAETERAAVEANLGHRITLVHGDAHELSQLFSPASFSVVVCHNVIEFVDRPPDVLRAIRSLLAPGENAVASVVVRNRAGEVLSAAIKNHDLDEAERNLTASKVRPKLADQLAAVFTPRELRDALTLAGLDCVAEFGVRVFSDYLPAQSADERSNYSALLALERKLGARSDFAAIARYIQIIAHPQGSEHRLPRRTR